MRRNKNKLLAIALAAIFLLANSQNVAAQNNSVSAEIDGDGDTDGTIEAKGKEQQGYTINKADPSRFNNVAIIQGLNKITAKTSILEIRVGDTLKFGKLTITIHKCWQSPLDQKPESKVLMDVYESNGNENKARIFYGWMFASSPSISALEHPIYDITVVGCKNK
jgi:hypothetical protein